MNTPFSVIILAAGQSSRMGQDKAELRWHGLPLWQHQQQLAQALGAEDILVSHPVYGTSDRQPGFGPLGGLHTLLPQCRHPLVLVLAIDMPLLSLTLLRDLLHASTTHPTYFEHYALPCVLHNTAAVQHYIEQNLTSTGQRSIKALLAFCQAQALTCPAPQLLANTNTPSEWQQSLALQETL